MLTELLRQVAQVAVSLQFQHFQLITLLLLEVVDQVVMAEALAAVVEELVDFVQL
jgi:hypothetical protein